MGVGQKIVEFYNFHCFIILSLIISHLVQRSTYLNSTKTFFFDFSKHEQTRYPAPDGGVNAVCSDTSYGPCFGKKDLYFSCCSLEMNIKRRSPLYESWQRNQVRHNNRYNNRVYIEVFYKA